MPTPSIQTLVTDAQQVLNLDSISAVRSVVAVALANANTGTPLNPNLTTQQLWNEFYQVVTKPKSDIESIIANQLMKFLYDPPAPGGVAGSGRVIFNKNGQLTTDPSFTWDDVLKNLTIGGNARTGSGTVGSPSHSFGSDTNTGAYNPGPDIYSIVTGGIERFRVDASGNITASGTFTALGGLDSSSIRAAASDYAAVNFDGATSGTRIAAPCQALGTGDFSLWSRFRVPSSAVPSTGNGANPGVLWVSDINTGTFRANAMGIYLEGVQLRVFRYGTTPATDNRIATVASFINNFGGQVVDLVVTRAGNTLKIYINGTDTAYTEISSGAAPAWGQTVVSDFALVGAQSANNVFTGRIYRSVVFNRALSASDVTELITVGVNPADQWGTQTAAYTSDFSAGTDSWSAARGTAAGNIDGISGVDNTLRFTVDTTASNTHLAFLNPVPGLLAGKRYRVGFNYFITAANATMNGLALWQLSPSVQISTVQSVTGAWTSITPVEFVSGETRLAVLGAAGGNANFTGNGTDTFYLHSFVVTRIGAIVDLDFTVGAGYQATDLSTNALHGTLFNGVEFTVPKRVAVLYATTIASGNTQMLGTLAIPTNAVIEDIIVNSTGSATVSVGNVSAGTQIVNGAAVVSGRQKLTLAGISSTTGNLWVNSSAAVTLQFTILYTIAA